ncbi:XRE family transcriptional regulator [Tolumonas lignilytica]|uniref:XRE family transcriptional regulator n=1 Tax=Tolumonas lignilytica TaxID=1283284 RepID=UPI000467D330|nr:XRE family transcriptional regulator [Tolumonas lignilytica]
MAKSTAQKINELLNLQDKSKADLARAIGVSNQTVTLWCKELDQGGSEPKKDKMIPIAAFFGVSPLALIALDDVGEIQSSTDKAEILRIELDESNSKLKPSFIKSFIVTPSLLSQEIPGVNAASIRYVLAFDDSMAETINIGETVFVDTGINDVISDGIYVFTMNKQSFIKRLQRIPDGSLLMISDNKQYEPFTIPSSERASMKVIGKVITSLSLKRIQ